MTRDPGLQPERTAMAWSRTAMALFVNALLIVRSGWLHHHGEVLALGVVLLALSAAVLVFAWRRGSAILRAAEVPAVLRPAVPLLMAWASGLACAAAMWVVATRLLAPP